MREFNEVINSILQDEEEATFITNLTEQIFQLRKALKYTTFQADKWHYEVTKKYIETKEMDEARKLIEGWLG